MAKEEETPRFSPKVIVEKEHGKVEKNVETAKATKRAKGKTNSKYEVRYINGVKHMILKDNMNKLS